jgi:hypothetical protein
LQKFARQGAYNKISSLLTAGPRLGYAWDRLLVFATGGYAGGNIDGQYVCTAISLAVAPGPACPEVSRASGLFCVGHRLVGQTP